jgi:flagellar biosynthesis GTPase FlhF
MEVIMRKYQVLLGLILGGLMGFVALARVAAADKISSDSASPDSQNSSWVTRFFADDDKGPSWRVRAKRQKDKMERELATARKKPDSTKDKAKKADDSPEVSKHEQEVAELKREQAAYLRRLAVCDQLKDVALKNSDDQLMRQAEELEAQAKSVYENRVAHLSAGKVGDETEIKEENP